MENPIAALKQIYVGLLIYKMEADTEEDTQEIENFKEFIFSAIKRGVGEKVFDEWKEYYDKLLKE